MEGKKYILSFLLLMVAGIVMAQNNKIIYNAYATGNMQKWKFAMDSIDGIRQKSNKQMLELINYQYGYIGWCIGQKNSAEAENLINKALTNINYLEKKQYKVSVLYAYQAAFVGFEIGLAPYKAPFLGSKSVEYAQKSVGIDSLNVLGLIQLGNIAYYTPKVFGGSKTEALKHYLAALKIMEGSTEFTMQNWNYLNLLATIIHAYSDLNQFEAARQYCLKTLAIEPQFHWVKNTLYPQVLKNLT